MNDEFAQAPATPEEIGLELGLTYDEATGNYDDPAHHMESSGILPPHVYNRLRALEYIMDFALERIDANRLPYGIDKEAIQFFKNSTIAHESDENEIFVHHPNMPTTGFEEFWTVSLQYIYTEPLED